MTPPATCPARQQSAVSTQIPEISAGTFQRILVCLDASDYANRALKEAVRLAGSADGTVIGIHAYAAKLHDHRFRQMEGGLPERYRKEQEMENQREVHDTLITRGLGLISDSYHDEAQIVCEAGGVPLERLSPEGKNYRRIVEAASSGDYGAIALGAHGLGIVQGAAVGTVCERVVRRSPIDALVIRDTERAIGDGPLVVGMDGSPRSFGVLMLAFDMARRTGGQVHAVAAYDPFFHYVAFEKIADALSEEAAEEFRFKEQESLHEEIIDSGIARIYQSHLDVAKTVAEDEGVELTTQLLEGKPYQAIIKYLEQVDASLLLVGKTGVHADPDLDIGGTSENLLRKAPCHIWLGQNTFTPPFEAVARETITWTEEAETMMENVPETARSMVRIAILRLAQESGHTVITSNLIEEATSRFCPDRGGRMETPKDTPWSKEAKVLLDKVGDPMAAPSIRLRAEKRARRDDADCVEVDHVRPFLEEGAAETPDWETEALARLSRVPEMVRGAVRRRAEAYAIESKAPRVSLEIAEEAIAEGKQAMGCTMSAGGHKSGMSGPDDKS
jgi:nucleotide-binding universal stress UspA family protein